MSIPKISNFMMKSKKLTKERRIAAVRELKRLQRYGIKKVEELGLRKEDVQRLIDEHRTEE